MTNSTTPEVLSDKALEEIETRPSVKTDQWCLHRVLITESERDALCRTVRATWARTNEALTEQRRELGAQYDDLDDKFGRVRIAAKKEIERLELQNAALREQLAHRTVELENESREMQKWNNRANQLAIEGQELRQRLAQVEKERNLARREVRALRDTIVKG